MNCPHGHWQRAGPNLCIQLDHGAPDDFHGALNQCKDWSTPHDPKEAVFKDWSSLITVKRLLELLDQPARYFSHEVWINAVFYNFKWYQIARVSKKTSKSVIDYIKDGDAELIPQHDLDQLVIAGANSPKHFGNGDSLVYNPKNNHAYKRDKGKGKFSYICTHKLKGEPGQWGDWSACSVTCNGGTRSRSRQCIKDFASQQNCLEEQLEEESTCNEQLCCGCKTENTVDNEDTCNNDGQCSCLLGYAGLQCSSCQSGYVESSSNCIEECEFYNCNAIGTSTCSGGCNCKTGYAAPECSTCQTGYVESSSNCIESKYMS